MSRRRNPHDSNFYATNEQFIAFFVSYGIQVENVRIDTESHRRFFNVVSLPRMSLDMDSSAEVCLEEVRQFISQNHA